jgi:putative hemolysin
MPTEQSPRYRVRQAATEADIAAAQSLRALAFWDRPEIPDSDRFDPLCLHVLVEDRRDGRLVCCFRLMPLADGQAIGQTYSAQFYELSALAGYGAPMVEMGRFCLHPQAHDPDILRVAWAELARFVDARGIGLLFGCASFKGTEAAAYMDAFALLKERHLAPRRWLPRVKAPAVFRFAQMLRARRPDMTLALRGMPPLLRSYLAMGGWVSDHAVVDRDMNTLHVFTGVEISAIPPARVRRLRMAAG